MAAILGGHPGYAESKPAVGYPMDRITQQLHDLATILDNIGAKVTHVFGHTNNLSARAGSTTEGQAMEPNGQFDSWSRHLEGMIYRAGNVHAQITDATGL